MRSLAFANPLPLTSSIHRHVFRPAVSVSVSVSVPVPVPVAVPVAVARSPVALITVDSNSYTTPVKPLGDYVFQCPHGQTFHQRARALVADAQMPASVARTLESWYVSYNQAACDNPAVPGDGSQFTEHMFSTLLELSRQSIARPIHFQSFHQRIRTPFDYYKFGIDFASILYNPTESTILGLDNARKAFDYVRAGENVIFLSNHQSEGDPHSVDLMLENQGGYDKSFCEKILFMAGDRVREDPVVMPFSAGRNLLTVYSKKHINDVPNLLQEKITHNRRTVSEMQSLFSQGGCAVWVAPSGGRDRRNVDTGKIDISPFDDSSIDMFRLTAVKSGTPCHFFPMALSTYHLLPPPSNVGGVDLGEERTSKYGPLHMFLGDEIDWDAIAPTNVKDRALRRRIQRDNIESIVREGYRSIGGYEI